VDDADVILLADYLAGNLRSDDLAPADADLNQDGAVDAVDLAILKRLL